MMSPARTLEKNHDEVCEIRPGAVRAPEITVTKSARFDDLENMIDFVGHIGTALQQYQLAYEYFCYVTINIRYPRSQLLL